MTYHIGQFDGPLDVLLSLISVSYTHLENIIPAVVFISAFLSIFYLRTVFYRPQFSVFNANYKDTRLPPSIRSPDEITLPLPITHIPVSYTHLEVRINALHDASFTIEKGEICVIVGPSGAGKTTLLNILGGMDSLTTGKVLIEGEDISQYSKTRLTSYRRYDIGFVFQFYNLIQNLTALENVEMAAQICKNPLDPKMCIRDSGMLYRSSAGSRLSVFPALWRVSYPQV